MTTFPMLRNRQVRNDGDGRLANQYRERYFWQSRASGTNGRAELFELTDIPALAATIRKGRTNVTA